eukprot:gene13031-9325_t
MSSLEVTWSDDWDVAQLAAAADGDGDGDGDGDAAPPDSLGSIANLWFFAPAASKATRFELQLRCRVAAKDARVTIRCSARYVEAFVVAGGAQTYVATSKGAALPATEEASPLYAHDLVVPASSAADALRLRFVSLATVAPPAAFAAAEPSVAARAADFQLLQIARLDVAGVAAAAAQRSAAAQPSPSASSTAAAPAAGGFPDAARLAALMAMGPPPAAAPGGRPPDGA